MEYQDHAPIASVKRLKGQQGGAVLVSVWRESLGQSSVSQCEAKLTKSHV